MIVRSEWAGRRWQTMLSPRAQLRPLARKHARGFGKMVIVSLTAVYLLWLFYRLLVQPEWVAWLPSLVRELLVLIGKPLNNPAARFADPIPTSS